MKRLTLKPSTKDKAEGKFHEMKGKVKEKNGTFIRFTPDPTIFKDYAWNDEFIEKRLRYYVYLNSGLTIAYNKQQFVSRGGLADLLQE